MEKQVAIMMHRRDNVATALIDLEAGRVVSVGLDETMVTVALRDDIPFGHKLALRDIAAGEEILKYGLPIGKALEAIPAGTWVHVHNCRSEHFGFRHEKYGIRA